MDGSSGPDLPDRYRRAADYVSKILRGTRPGDLPVQRPEKFQLVVNLKTHVPSSGHCFSPSFCVATYP